MNCPYTQANEKHFERKLSEKIKQRGGLSIKLTSHYFTGLPDRMILMPGNRTYFVELKSTGKKPTERQQYVMNELYKLGFFCTVIDTEVKLAAFLKQIDDETP